jgi:hypothetical protein
MPERFPRWAKMRADECDHEAFWCWACSINIVPRVGATDMLMLGVEGHEDGIEHDPAMIASLEEYIEATNRDNDY